MPVTDSDLLIAQDPGTPPGSIAEAARAHADSQPPVNVPRRSSSSIPPGTRPSGTYSQQYPRLGRPDDVKTSEHKPFDTTTSEYKPFETKTTEYKPVEFPEHVRGAINYAVLTAELSGAGIHARREDGLVKFVAWGEIVGIVARRLPPAAPYEGATIVDLVSTVGSTLRIVPWTQIKGHQFAESTVARAREFVNIVAAQSLDARLDAPTKLFADSEGQASQLPDAAMLALHDQKLA
jgi:hypothetical protein